MVKNKQYMLRTGVSNFLHVADPFSFKKLLVSVFFFMQAAIVLKYLYKYIYVDTILDLICDTISNNNKSYMTIQITTIQVLKKILSWLYLKK